MLPDRFRFFDDALPLTATGKIDRKTLAEESAESGFARPPFAAPRGPIELGVAALYEQILELKPIGRDDDFFLLGGDSLSSVQLQAGVAEVFGRELSQGQLLEDASVAAVARALARVAPAGEKRDELLPVLVPVREIGSGPSLFMVHGRHGHAHVSPAFMRMLDDDLSLYMFQARGLDGRQAPHRTIEAMAENYVRAMGEVQPRGPYLLGGLCSGGYVAIEMARLLRAAGESVGPLLLFDPVVLARRLPLGSVARVRRAVGILFPAWRRFRHRRVLRSLQAAGRIRYDESDPHRKRGAGQVVIALEDALSRYRLDPYEGSVELLLSADRRDAGGWGDPAVLKAAFPGEVRCHEVAASHGQALDVSNEHLAGQVRQSLRHMREAVSVLGNLVPSGLTATDSAEDPAGTNGPARHQ
jgi:thioesterase domain-containing protein